MPSSHTSKANANSLSLCALATGAHPEQVHDLLDLLTTDELRGVTVSLTAIATEHLVGEFGKVVVNGAATDFAAMRASGQLYEGSRTSPHAASLCSLAASEHPEQVHDLIEMLTAVELRHAVLHLVAIVANYMASEFGHAAVHQAFVDLAALNALGRLEPLDE